MCKLILTVKKRENVKREAADHLSERSRVGDSPRRQAFLENMPLS